MTTIIIIIILFVSDTIVRSYITTLTALYIVYQKTGQVTFLQ